LVEYEFKLNIWYIFNYNYNSTRDGNHSQPELNAIFICPIAIAYSMGQIIKSVCVCQSVYLSVRLQALSWSHFLIDFHQNWHSRKNPQKEEQVR